MPVSFPGDSAEYQAARNRLVEQEIELRRAMEAVADARRRLPPGGAAPADYGFQPQAPDGAPTPVRLSELFTPDKNSLVIYSMMFSSALRTRCSYGWAGHRARRGWVPNESLLAPSCLQLARCHASPDPRASARPIPASARPARRLAGRPCGRRRDLSWPYRSAHLRSSCRRWRASSSISYGCMCMSFS
jgi:hypothetical protein